MRSNAAFALSGSVAPAQRRNHNSPAPAIGSTVSPGGCPPSIETTLHRSLSTVERWMVVKTWVPNRAIGICNRDRTFEGGLKCLPDIKPLVLAADQHQYRLELARDLARASAAAARAVFRGGGGFARKMTASSFGCRSALAVSIAPAAPRSWRLSAPWRARLLLCLRRNGRAKCSVGGRQLRLGPGLGFRFSAARAGHHGSRGLPVGRRRGEFWLLGRFPGCFFRFSATPRPVGGRKPDRRTGKASVGATIIRYAHRRRIERRAASRASGHGHARPHVPPL